MSRIVRNPVVCPHCGKPIRKAPKPRDLGLLLHVLTYRVKVESEITEEHIDAARQHCKMSPERLAELRGKDHARFWGYMLEKRALRLEWLNVIGHPPPYGWTPPREGERDNRAGVQAMKAYYKIVAKLKAKMRRNPEAQAQKIFNRYLRSKRLRSDSRKWAALTDVEARLAIKLRIENGEFKMSEYRALKACMLPDDHYSPTANAKAKEERSAKTLERAMEYVNGVP